MENITPMLKQYQKVKERYPDCILFFRLGDFYEMFFQDAQVASGILDLVLTSRSAGSAGKVPMCGVPYHAASSYIGRLIKAGKKVAICEQLEDPAKAKGIVKRDVVRVITSGTFIDESSFMARYLLAINIDRKAFGLAFSGTTEGTIQAGEYETPEAIFDVLSRYPVCECLFPASQKDRILSLLEHPMASSRNLIHSPCEDWFFNPEMAATSLKEHFRVQSLSGFGLGGKDLAIGCAGALLEYLKQMNQQPMVHINRLSLYVQDDYLYLSPAACSGLEIEQLIEVIDRTRTPMGRRLFRQWVYHPLKEKKEILKRQRAVTTLKEKEGLSSELEKILFSAPDVEKSLSRISCGSSTPRDFLALRQMLGKTVNLKNLLNPLSQAEPLLLVEDVPEVRTLLEKAINPELSLSQPEGTVIREGFDEILDHWRNLQKNGRQWLSDLQAREIRRTGIASLKVGYNQVFGYYLEVSKPNLSLVPPDYIRKQTLVNGERFVTPELKEFEEKMLVAEEKLREREKELIDQITKEILANCQSLHAWSNSLARIDVLVSLSRLASQSGYVCPEINSDGEIVIRDGRHPVVEQTTSSPFVPNDTLLDCENNHLLVITGPNMAGKSTYIRQVALITILAQLGSYVPAKEARIGLVDRIFTRIGARDDITHGLSTFMIEMAETASILNQLTPRSLVILDEIGRGTSTADGFSLAWAVAEHLHSRRVRTLFATHFHELTALAERFPGVKNYNVAVEEQGREIVFLHKIKPGGTDESYGIYVAELAGLPQQVVRRARQLLRELEIKHLLKEKLIQAVTSGQTNLFSEEDEEVMESVGREMELLKQLALELKNLDINNLTPVEALNLLHRFQSQLHSWQAGGS
ncbi:MAG: DNA mismatch repair protein MutS [Candidatus Omnitrophica bacterium]|nr:DNA mismatch repair protein MutS [Candidatus Omnitrophota bacterium]